MPDHQADPGSTPSLERALLDLAVGFVNVPLEELDAAIDHTLRTVGELSGVARSYLFTYDWDQLTCTNTHEWCAPGVRPVRGQLQQRDLTGMDAWLDAHGAGRVVYRPDATDPSLDTAERTAWASQGVSALVSIPLLRHDDCVGFVGFDMVDGPKHWSEQDLELLGELAELLSHAEERRELERLRRATEERSAANEQLAAAQRMATMIDRLLGYAAAGREIGTPTPVSLDRVLAVAREHVASELEDRQGEVVVSALPSVLGDEVRLVEVFQNLLANAILHAPDDRVPMLRVRGHRHGDTVTATVADNGSGIAAADRARVLRSFERGPGLEVPGSGLGLPLCTRIVDAHGGSMQLGDSSLGGLKVTVHLPAVPAPAG